MRKVLLDVSVMLATLLKKHPDHRRAVQWLNGVKPVLCPITQLGWVRISSKVYGLTVAEAIRSLKTLENRSEFIPCDLPLGEAATAPSSRATTDWYLADLAKKHGMRWATLDARSDHPNAELITEKRTQES